MYQGEMEFFLKFIDTNLGLVTCVIILKDTGDIHI